MNSFRVLVIDDDSRFLERFRMLSEGTFDLETATSVGEGIERLDTWDPDAVLLDVDFDGEPAGLDALADIRSRDSVIPIIMVSDDRSQATAVEAMKRGADDFVSKHPQLSVVRAQIERILGQARWREAARRLQLDATACGLVGRSRALAAVREQIARVGPLDTRVLITGETGTGKELVAGAIHSISARAGNPFIKINAAGSPDTLFDSDIFGHERGAFTGAVDRRRGWLELASGGTFLLDEVGKLSPERQGKLLRVVEDGSIVRTGGARAIDIDVRWITAASEDLRSMVRDGRFLADFFYRIASIEIRVPPLREHVEDIPDLVHHILGRIPAGSNGTAQLAEGALEPLYEHVWPGNFRELEKVVTAAVVFAPKGRVLRADDFVAALTPEKASAFIAAAHSADWQRYMTGSFKEGMAAIRDAFERAFIASALTRHDGNVTRAAKRLGWRRPYLSRRLHALGIRRGTSTAPPSPPDPS